MSLRTIFTVLNPFKSLDYYRHYIQMAELIVLYGDVKAICVIKTLIFLHLYNVLQLIYLKLFSPSYQERVANANGLIMFYNGQNQSIDLVLGAITLMGAHFYQRFYLKANPKLIKYFNALLFGPVTVCRSMFIGKFYQTNDETQVEVYFRKFCHKLLHFFQVFTIMIGKTSFVGVILGK